MSKEEKRSLINIAPSCSSDEQSAAMEKTSDDIVSSDKKERFEWMTEPLNDEPSGAETTAKKPQEDSRYTANGISVVPWQTYCSLPQWNVHRVKVQCDTYSPHSTLYGTFQQTVAGKIALELGQDTIDMPAMDLEGSTVVSLSVEVEGKLLQVAARITATSGPISLRLGRDVLAGRFLVDTAKRGEGNS